MTVEPHSPSVPAASPFPSGRSRSYRGCGHTANVWAAASPGQGRLGRLRVGRSDPPAALRPAAQQPRTGAARVAVRRQAALAGQQPELRPRRTHPRPGRDRSASCARARQWRCHSSASPATTSGAPAAHSRSPANSSSESDRGCRRAPTPRAPPARAGERRITKPVSGRAGATAPAASGARVRRRARCVATWTAGPSSRPRPGGIAGA